MQYVIGGRYKELYSTAIRQNPFSRYADYRRARTHSDVGSQVSLAGSNERLR